MEFIWSGGSQMGYLYEMNQKIQLMKIKAELSKSKNEFLKNREEEERRICEMKSNVRGIIVDDTSILLE